MERLHERLTKALASRDAWQTKALELDRSLKQMVIEKEHLDAHARALSDRIEILESDLKRAKSEQQGSSTPSPPTPRMTGGNPDAPKHRPSVSMPQKPKKDREAERAEREQEREREQQKEKDKLKKRFALNDDSDRSGGSSSTKTNRSRRDSYVEPMGPGGQRPLPTYLPAMSSNHIEPFVAQVPRNVVVQYYAEPAAAYEKQGYEDGNYMAHPLPSILSSKGKR